MQRQPWNDTEHTAIIQLVQRATSAEDFLTHAQSITGGRSGASIYSHLFANTDPTWRDTNIQKNVADRLHAVCVGSVPRRFSEMTQVACAAPARPFNKDNRDEAIENIAEGLRLGVYSPEQAAGFFARVVGV